MSDLNTLTTSKAHYVPDVFTNINGLKGLENREDKDGAFKEVAKQFESMFINIMLKNMRQANAVFEEDSLFNTNESRMYRDMYDNQLSLSLAQGKGIGLAETLYRQLKGQFGDNEDGSEGEQSLITAPHQFERALEKRLAETPPALAKSAQPVEPISKSNHVPSEQTPTFSLPEVFIEKIKPLIDNTAKAMGFHPLALLAQAALETGWGKHMVGSDTGENSHNLFNIKADKRWQGEKVSVVTTEFRAGAPVKEQADFRSYDSFESSVTDYVRFIKDNPRYQSALSVKDNALEYVQALQDAGYATDPNYADKIGRVIRTIESIINEGKSP